MVPSFRLTSAVFSFTVYMYRETGFYGTESVNMDKHTEIRRYIISGEGMNFNVNLRPSASGNSVFSYNMEIARIDRASRNIQIHPKNGWIMSHTTRKHVNTVVRAVAGLQGWTITELKDPVEL